jgi:hypothetical protein
VTVGAVSLCTGQSGVAPESPGSPPQCHQELPVGLLFPGAPDSPACCTGLSKCATGQSGALSRTVRQWQHFALFLGLCLILVDLNLWSS